MKPGASFTLILALACCVAALSPAQQRAPAIHAQSSLVLVDIISQDQKTGLPIRDFQRSDFRIFADDRELPIASFDSGARYDTRPVIVWLVVICNERGKIGGSAEFVGNERWFRPAFDQLDKQDTVGVAHWCDNGESRLDLEPSKDRDAPIAALTEAIRPIRFHTDRPDSDRVGEATFRRLIRLIIQNTRRRNPEPLPVIVFLDGDYTGQPPKALNQVIDDFLETSGVVFGISDSSAPKVPTLGNGEIGGIEHYMADQTGGQYFAAPPAGYATALEMILMQLHFRYEIGFVPPALDGKRHLLKVELTGEAKKAHPGVRLRYRPEYIPVPEVPDWAR